MAQYILLNSVRVGTQQYLYGTKLNDLNQDLRPIIAAGAQLVTLPNQSVEDWADRIADLRAKGSFDPQDAGYPLLPNQQATVYFDSGDGTPTTSTLDGSLYQQLDAGGQLWQRRNSTWLPVDGMFARTVSGGISKGQVARTTGAAQAMTLANTNPRTVQFSGVALSDANDAAVTTFQSNGPLDPAVKNLGAGIACAVGIDASGNMVRATDPSCASAPNWIGDVDAYGNVTIRSRRSDGFNVLDFGAVGDGTVDDTAAFVAVLASIGEGGKIRVPTGTYKITSDLGAFPRGTRLCGDVGAGLFQPASTLRFYMTSGSGLYPWREANQNSTSGIVIEDLHISNAEPANTTGAGIEFMGGGSFFVRRCRTTGWNYHIILDGTNNAYIQEHSFQGDGMGVANSARSIWLTEGNERGHGWTLPTSTNGNQVRDCFFNASRRAVHVSGGGYNAFQRCLANMGGDEYTVYVGSGCYQLAFDGFYIEGSVGAGDPIPPGCVQVAGGFNIAFRNFWVSTGGATGWPAFDFTGPSRFVTFDNCFVTCGSATDGTIRGSGNLYEGFFGPNYFVNNHGGPVFDGSLGFGAFMTSSFTSSDTQYRGGVNTSGAPESVWHIGSTASPGSLLMAKTIWGNKVFDVAWTSSFGEASLVSKGLRAQGGSGRVEAGSRDGLCYLPLAAGAPETPFVDTWDIPTDSTVFAEVTVIGQKTDGTERYLQKTRLEISRNGSSTPVIQLSTDLFVPTNTDAFVTPIISIASNRLQIAVTGQPYITNWLARVDLTVAVY